MLDSRRIEILENAKNRFFYDRVHNTLHDRSCSQIRLLDDKRIDVYYELRRNDIRRARLCPECRRMLAIRSGMRNRMSTSSRYFFFFLGFFKRIGAEEKDLIRLFLEKEGELSYISENCVQIKVNEDTWRVALEGKTLELQHNNYVVDDHCNRVFTSGFHMQRMEGLMNAFHHYTNTMAGYTFDYHRREIEEYYCSVRREKIQVRLAITDNYTAFPWKSLLYDYYTFVDFRGIAVSSGKEPRFRVLNIMAAESKSDDLALVTCQIPKWRRGSFITVMSTLKSAAIQEESEDYLLVCESTIPQIA